VRGAVTIAAAAVTVAGLGYAAFALARTVAFALRRDPPSDAAPTVTVFKPLYGREPDLEANLRSFCEQEYPLFEVLFCARDADDPALHTARRLVAEFPYRARVLVGDDDTLANPKMRTLAGCAHAARGEIVVVADADVRVARGYVRALVAPFADPRVGAATALYRGAPRGGWVAELGAMGIEEQFVPSALVATALEPLHFCFGATMAVRRETLAAIGGFASLGQALADDHALGSRVAASGARVALVREVVATAVGETSLRDLWEHELRWARTTRGLRPRENAFAFITFPFPLALVTLALARDRRGALVLVAAALSLRIAISVAARHALGVVRPARPWLIPVRDMLGIAVWCAALGGRAVRWGTKSVAIAGDGRTIVCAE
jgi:ceramide glucosyltransferase